MDATTPGVVVCCFVDWRCCWPCVSAKSIANTMRNAGDLPETATIGQFSADRPPNTHRVEEAQIVGHVRATLRSLIGRWGDRRGGASPFRECEAPAEHTCCCRCPTILCLSGSEYAGIAAFVRVGQQVADFPVSASWLSAKERGWTRMGVAVAVFLAAGRSGDRRSCHTLSSLGHRQPAVVSPHLLSCCGAGRCGNSVQCRPSLDDSSPTWGRSCASQPIRIIIH